MNAHNTVSKQKSVTVTSSKKGDQFKLLNLSTKRIKLSLCSQGEHFLLFLFHILLALQLRSEMLSTADLVIPAKALSEEFSAYVSICMNTVVKNKI